MQIRTIRGNVLYVRLWLSVVSMRRWMLLLLSRRGRDGVWSQLVSGNKHRGSRRICAGSIADKTLIDPGRSTTGLPHQQTPTYAQANSRHYSRIDYNNNIYVTILITKRVWWIWSNPHQPEAASNRHCIRNMPKCHHHQCNFQARNAQMHNYHTTKKWH